MIDLFADLKDWQKINKKRFLHLNIVMESDALCCIALTNPSEVVIVAQSDGVICDDYGEIHRSPGSHSLLVK